MIDRQQIAEMAIHIKNSMKSNKKIGIVLYPYIAQDLHNAGYRKVGENSVVLTKEEFDRLNACIKSEEEVRAIVEQQMLPMFKELVDKEMNKKLATVTALERKATAQEFLLQVVKQSSRMEMVSNGIVLKTTYSINRDELIEIAKQFDVEVEQ